MIALSKVEAVQMRSKSFKEDDIKVMRSFSFKKGESESLPTPKSSKKIVLEHSPSFKNWEPEKKLEANLSFKSQSLEAASQPVCVVIDKADNEVVPVAAAEVPFYKLISPRPKTELDECATKLQKVYKSYRTRRNLADAAVIVEELWWQALDYACLNSSSVSFYHDGQPEKPGSRWSRAKRRLAKVGKGLSKDQKAQKLAIQHWLEAIDPRHRYGHNLHFYYEKWSNSASTQPFFYWLDAGDGKKVDIEKMPRNRLQSQIIKYLGPTERESYEVVLVDGRLIYKQERLPVNTTEGSKWIFVLSTSKNLYVGKKRKGRFQHSSFLAGAATTAAGRLEAKDGYLQAIWRHSGHYLPTDENLSEFKAFLTENHVDLSNVKIFSVDNDEHSSFRKSDKMEITNAGTETDVAEASGATAKWSTGAGARIGCVRDYPMDLQVKALEHVRLSPRIPPSSGENLIPIPSPRPSPKMRISPHLTRMGFSPRAYTADLQVMTLDNGSPIGNKIPTTSPRRSPVIKSSPRTPFTGFPQPKVTLRLPSWRGRKCHH